VIQKHPFKLGSRKHKPLGPVPGEYVREM